MPTREAVMEALKTQCATATTTLGSDVSAAFNTVSRRMIDWQAEQGGGQQRLVDLPCLILWESPDAEEYVWGNRGIGPIRYWNVHAIIYCKIPDGETPGVQDGVTAGASVLNPLLDALEAALAPPDKDGLQTLGGLVIDCRIDGTIIKALGDVDPSGMNATRVPLKIQVQ